MTSARHLSAVATEDGMKLLNRRIVIELINGFWSVRVDPSMPSRAQVFSSVMAARTYAIGLKMELQCPVIGADEI